ncbi:MAG: di-trans,poly-cis-decaprenylcistransferase [Alphaproteobacteria bacterium]|nr:di-trans,poly-cis-decaprenylcistransferase [Alphaproteobacteria bacterium]
MSVRTDGLRIPGHLAVTMDGNGRWAAARGRPRTDGHAEGIKALRRLVEYAIAYGVGHLTIFSFSSENWTRPAQEVSFLFSLMRRFVDSDLKRLIKNGVRVRFLGSRDRLDAGVLALMDEVTGKTARGEVLELLVAFNYGGRQDIADAARALARQVRDQGLDPEAITAEVFAAALATGTVPDPDVVLRTSGEQRLSNFLLWQSAYSELIFIDTLWPDFDESAFRDMLIEYTRRDRRFGGLGQDTP